MCHNHFHDNKCRLEHVCRLLELLDVQNQARPVKSVCDMALHTSKKQQNLPGWMLKAGTGTSDECEEEDANYITFPGSIAYCPTIDDIGQACEKLLSTIEKQEELALGFDAEWPVTCKGSGKIALLQICADENTCYLFHVSRSRTVPRIFFHVLFHPKVRVVGNCIKNDIRKLAKDFNFQLSDLILSGRVIDLGELANQVLNCAQTWSLAALSLNLLSKNIDKTETVRKSSWHNSLTPQQMMYAATDAYVSLLIYRTLKSKEL